MLCQRLSMRSLCLTSGRWSHYNHLDDFATLFLHFVALRKEQARTEWSGSSPDLHAIY